MAETEKVVEKPVVYTPPSRQDIEALSQALAEDGVIEKPVAAAPEAKSEPPATAPAPEKPTEAKAEAKTEEIPAITKIAAKQAAFRKEVEEYKPYLEALKRAKAERDPVAALQALGFTHAQYAERVLDLEPKPDAPDAKPETKTRGVDPEIEELRAFKKQYEAERAQVSRQQALQGIEATIKKAGDKFKHLSALERWDSVEQVIINYHSQNGALPGDTFEESVMLAAEVVEGALKQEAQKWAKLYGGLTSGSSPASVNVQKAPEPQPSTGAETARTLTNSNTTAPAAVRPVPKTRQEIIAAILEGREDELT